MKDKQSIAAPISELELLQRANSLSGKTIQHIAAELKQDVPGNLLRAKGWVGELLETYLGATATSLPEPDFQHIGVELKTLPIAINGRPKESTYVCTVPLSGSVGQQWEDSVVWAKLKRVLWVPVEASNDISLPRRRIGCPFIWSPSKQQEEDLCNDWHEHMEKINAGELPTINASHGKYLQIRPKANNARALTQTRDESGNVSPTLPRGFYLRTDFTYQLLCENS